MKNEKYAIEATEPKGQTYISSCGLQGRRTRRSDSSGCGSCVGHTSHTECESCSSSYRNSLFPSPEFHLQITIHKLSLSNNSIHEYRHEHRIRERKYHWSADAGTLETDAEAAKEVNLTEQKLAAKRGKFIWVGATEKNGGLGLSSLFSFKSFLVQRGCNPAE